VISARVLDLPFGCTMLVVGKLAVVVDRTHALIEVQLLLLPDGRTEAETRRRSRSKSVSAPIRIVET
jgi:hypothetical protein